MGKHTMSMSATSERKKAGRPVRTPEKRGTGAKRRTANRWAWLFLSPFLAVYLIFVLYPVGQGVFMGFFSWDLLAIDQRTFIGWDNYVRMFWGENIIWDPGHLLAWRIPGLSVIVFLVIGWHRGRISGSTVWWLSAAIVTIFGVAMGFRPAEGSRWFDSQFWLAFGNTIAFVLMSTPLIVGVGLALALALNRPGRWVGLLRTLFFAPYVLSVAVLTLIWAFLLNPQLGLIGALTSWLGQEPISWLTSTTLAMPSIVVTTLWWTVGFNVVLFLAGLQDIDQSLYDAAAIDGAGSLSRFRNITVPGLARTTLLVLVLQIIASFQIFGQVFIMTRGGPNGATRVSIQHIYEAGFRDFELGYASAMSVFLFLVMIAVSALQFRFQRRAES